jgi:hypothetical protein
VHSKPDSFADKESNRVTFSRTNKGTDTNADVTTVECTHVTPVPNTLTCAFDRSDSLPHRCPDCRAFNDSYETSEYFTDSTTLECTNPTAD